MNKHRGDCMQTIKKELQKRGIHVTDEEANKIKGFYHSLQNLKMDFNHKIDSTTEMMLTQNTLKRE